MLTTLKRNFRMPLFMRILNGLAFCAVFFCADSMVFSADDNQKETPGEKPKKPHLIVMKQMDIRGRVLLLMEQGEKSATQNVKVQVYSGDGKKMVFKSKTDKDGGFSLPNLDVGVYKLKIGLLQMDLKVEDPLKQRGKTSHIPKVIVVFLPKEMEDLAAD